MVRNASTATCSTERGPVVLLWLGTVTRRGQEPCCTVEAVGGGHGENKTLQGFGE